MAGTMNHHTVYGETDIKPYVRSKGVSGNLNSIGSDTLNNLMTYWAEGFNRIYLNVRIQIVVKDGYLPLPAFIIAEELKKIEH